MADEVAAGATPSEEAAAVEAEAGGGQQPVKLVFEKYKTMEEAEKAHKEAERALGRAMQEKAEIAKELERARQETQLAKAIEKLAEKPSTAEADKKQTLQAFLEKVKAKRREDPGDALEDELGLFNSWLADAEKSTRGYADEKVTALQAKIDALESMVNEARMQQQPEFIEHREIVEPLIKAGMKADAAIAFAKGLAPRLKTEQPSRVTPPGSAGGARTMESSNDTPYLSREDIAGLKADGYTDAEIQVMEMTEKRNRLLEAAERKRLQGV